MHGRYASAAYTRQNAENAIQPYIKDVNTHILWINPVTEKTATRDLVGLERKLRNALESKKRAHNNAFPDS